jgi:hypothetical protein
MSLYDVLLLFHILAAIAWVGGAVTLNVLGTRIQRAGGTALAEYVRQTEWMGTRVFAPSTLAVLGLGIAMVAENEAWTIGQLWIILALIGIGVTMITGRPSSGPRRNASPRPWWPADRTTPRSLGDCGGSPCSLASTSSFSF